MASGAWNAPGRPVGRLWGVRWPQTGPRRYSCLYGGHIEPHVLNRAHTVQPKRLAYFLDANQNEHGFAGPLGDLLDPSVFTRNFEKLAAEAGLPKTRLHDLRHFHATLLLREGTHPKVVQERLGHSQISITLDTYSHVVPGLQEKAATTFAEAMRNQ